MRKRKSGYPTSRANKGNVPPGARPEIVRPTVATIDLTARAGRAGLSVGDHVRIGGTGFLAGEIAVIERLGGTVISTASVRTPDGRTRQVRTVDLEPIAEHGSPEPAIAEDAATPPPANDRAS